jgi:3-deoxy-D-manno-octulosonic-acid transferase
VWYTLYNIFSIPLMVMVVRLGGLFHPKLARVHQHRKGWRRDWQIRADSLVPDKPVVAFHCASVGEWEQARPLVEQIKQQRPDVQIAVTFMSPTATTHCVMPADVDVYGILPLDTPGNARDFFRILQPSVWVLIRNDIWPNHIRACRRQGIPIIWADANLPSSTRRLWWLVRNFYKNVFREFSLILPASDDSRERLLPFYDAPANLITAGETRFDQVWRRSQKSDAHLLDTMRSKLQSHIIIAGSTWPTDEIHIVPALLDCLEENADLTVIIVPHEPHEEHLRQLEKRFANTTLHAVRMSSINEEKSTRILLVDQVGILHRLYQLAEFAYVGGSFGSGVHNVMEPSVFGLPVIFGPRHRNSFEAVELHRAEAGHCVHNCSEAAAIFRRLLAEPELRTQMGRNAREIMRGHLGATDIVTNHIIKYLT